MILPVMAALVFTATAWAGVTGVPTTEVLHLSGTGEDDTVDWQFRCREGRGCGEWTTIPVPSSWELEGFGAYSYGFDEERHPDEGVYKTSFETPAHWADRRTWIVFDGVMTDAEVFLDGVRLGEHRGAFYPFRFEITDHVVGPGPHRLEVRVREESRDASVNRAERDADYWVFGGIFRPVRLESLPPEAIHELSVDARHDGRLRVRVEAVGGSADRVLARVETLDGESVGAPFGALIGNGSGHALLEQRLPGIRSWTAETPNLYRLRVRLLAGDRVLHETTERFGFRTVELVPGSGLHVNGRKVLLKGVNRHSFWPDAGRTTSPAISRRDVELLREMNLNAVRTSHYPPDEHFLDVCDELGIYVLDELAGWHDAYDTAAGTPLAEAMVRRDRNHPSVVLWANGNEGGWNRNLDRIFRRLDPQGRPLLHPDATFGGFDTEHYPSWQELAERLGTAPAAPAGLARIVANEVVLPTETLHGLYDGGGGAGLEGYWRAIRDSPRGGGLFLWAFLDEGVVRTDRHGAIDTAGNRAPDGIVGPYREREGSVPAIREIFSPLEVDLPRLLPLRYDGVVPIVNRFDHRTLGGRLEWSWKGVVGDDAVTLAEGAASLPALEPGNRGSVRVPAPPPDALFLDLRYVDGRGARRAEWGLALPRPDRPEEPSAARARRTEDGWALEAGADRVELDGAGRLRRLVLRDRAIDLTGGYPVPETSSDPEITIGAAAKASGAGTATLHVSRRATRLGWTLTSSGAARLDYEIVDDGSAPFRGIGFRFPFEAVRAARWLGGGPYRAWGNRLAGSRFGLWRRLPNRTVTGQSWDYPEFPGYYREVRRLALKTAEGPIRFDVDGVPWLQLFTPPPWEDPEQATAPFPEADLSLLHRIPGIGTKFHRPGEIAPAEPTRGSATHRGVLRISLP